MSYTLVLEFSGVAEVFAQKRGADEVAAFTDLVEMNRYADRSLYVNGWNGTDLLRSWMEQPLSSAVQQRLIELNARPVNGSVTGTAANEVLVGGGLVDSVNAGDGHDVISGAAGNDTLNAGLGNDVLLGGDGKDSLQGGAGSDLLLGGAGDDSLLADAGGEAANCDDELYGGAGNDSLWGGAGNDLLVGGVGNDTLAGNNGNDVYVFGLGDGQDTINNSDQYGADDGIDIVRFESGVNVDDIRVNMVGNSLQLLNAVSGDSVTAGSYFTSDQYSDAFYQEYYRRYRIDFIEFSDGTRWSVSDVNEMYLAQHQTEGNDTIYAFHWAQTLQMGGGNDVVWSYGGDDIVDGGAGADNLIGGTGADVLNGGSGNDTLQGDDGTDQLYGAEGDDLLSGGLGDDLIVGGAGADTLYGHQGNDTYVFNAGDGVDSIYSNSNGNPSLDVIQFGAGIAKEGFVLSRSNNNLIMTNVLTGNTLTLYGQFASETLTSAVDADAVRYQRFDRFEFANGDVWTATDINQIYVAQNTTAGSDTLHGFRWDEMHAMGEGNDIVYAYAGNDTVLGEGGNDTLNGGDNDDILDGGAGADTLRGGTGSDVLNGGSGNDTLYGDDGAEIGAGTDQLYGGEGDDLLYGGIGNDTLAGDAGTDQLNGGVGNDVLYGGLGSDTLTGATGNDIYRFALGDGADTSVDSDSTAGNQDVLQLDAGIALDQLWFKHVGTGLEISVIGTTDKVTVSNWYGGTANHVEQIQLADGHYLLDSKVEQLVSAMAGMTPPPAGQTTLSDAQRQQLDPVLAATWQTA